LEERFAACCHKYGRSVADENPESRRRRFLAEGRKFEDRRIEIPIAAANGRPLMVGEMMRSELKWRRYELEGPERDS
jgi:hypothetical protein